MSGISDEPIAGAPVEIVISEPWELASSGGGEAPSATVLGLEREGHGAHEVAIAVQLERPLNWSGQTYRFIIFRPSAPSDLESLKGGSSIEGTYIGMAVTPDALVGPGLIRRSKNWRGGLAGRADLRLIDDAGRDGFE